MNKQKLSNQKIFRRKKRTRVKISGTQERPRLTVFRSNKSSYAQLIDDQEGKTLVSASTIELKSETKKDSKQKKSELLGELLAKKALEKGIKEAIFDRGAYRYHGRVKAVAEAARKLGLKF